MDIPLPGEVDSEQNVPPEDIPPPLPPSTPPLSSPAFDIPLPSNELKIDTTKPPPPLPKLPPPLPSAGHSDFLKVLNITPPLPSGPPPDLLDDPNRYSPTKAIAEEEALKPEIPKGQKTTVLGRAQAKKRLLAFSMTKQGGGAGLSFGFTKKTSTKVNAGSAKAFTAGGPGEEELVPTQETNGKEVVESKDSRKKKKAKKGTTRDEKAKAVVSAIEEIKREEQLMRGVLGLPPLSDMAAPLSMMGGQPILSSYRTKDPSDSAFGVLTEQQKALESIVDTIISINDMDKKRRSTSDQERESKSASSRKRDSDSKKEDRHKDRHRSKSKERHSRRRSKERRKTLPSDWQEFHSGGYRMDEMRRLKLKVEKEAQERHRRDRRSRSREDRKHKKSPHSNEEKKDVHGDHDTFPFDFPPKLRFPFVAAGIHQVEKEYPKSLVRHTKTRPSLPYCENPKTSTAYYKKRSEILAVASPKIVEIMKMIMNSTPEPFRYKNEKSVSKNSDANLSSSLTALQVSYDENEGDENLSASDDATAGKERAWYLEQVVLFANWDGTDLNSVPTSLENSIKKEEEDNETVNDVKNITKFDSDEKPENAVEPIQVEKSEESSSSDEEENFKHTVINSNIAILDTERKVVRSKWDSDYEEEKGYNDENVASDLKSLSVEKGGTENWNKAEDGLNLINQPMEVKDDLNHSQTGLESHSTEENIMIETETSEINVDIDNCLLDDKSEGVVPMQIEDDEMPSPVLITSDNLENASMNISLIANSVDNMSMDSNPDLKLVSEYEEFMKAVNFDAEVCDGQNNATSNGCADAEWMKADSIFPEAVSNRELVSNDSMCEPPISENDEEELDNEDDYMTDEVQTEKGNSLSSGNKLEIAKEIVTDDSEKYNDEPEKVSRTRASRVCSDKESDSEHDSSHLLFNPMLLQTPIRSVENVCMPNINEESSESSSSDESSSSSDSSSSSSDSRHKKKSKKSKRKRKKKHSSSKRKHKKKVSKKKQEISSSSDSDTESSEDESSEDQNKEKSAKEKLRKKKAKESKKQESEGSSADSESSDKEKLSKSKKSKSKKHKKVNKKKKESKKRKRKRKDSSSSESDVEVKSKKHKNIVQTNSEKLTNKKLESHSSKKQSAKQVTGRMFDSNGNDFVELLRGADHKQRNDNKRKSKKDLRKQGHLDVLKKKDLKSEKRLMKKKISNRKEDSEEESSEDSSSEYETTKKNKKHQQRSSDFSNADGESDYENESKKAGKKRRRERRSRSTSPPSSNTKKRRRSPSTSPEHSPTPQRRNSTESKNKEEVKSKERSHDNRKLRQNESNGKRRGHMQDEVEDEGGESDSDETSENSFQRSGRSYRPLHAGLRTSEEDSLEQVHSEFEENSSEDEQEGKLEKPREEIDSSDCSDDETSNCDNKDDVWKLTGRLHDQSGYSSDDNDSMPEQLLRHDEIKKEVMSEEEFIGKDLINCVAQDEMSSVPSSEGNGSESKSHEKVNEISSHCSLLKNNEPLSQVHGNEPYSPNLSNDDENIDSCVNPVINDATSTNINFSESNLKRSLKFHSRATVSIANPILNYMQRYKNKELVPSISEESSSFTLEGRESKMPEIFEEEKLAQKRTGLPSVNIPLSSEVVQNIGLSEKEFTEYTNSLAIASNLLCSKRNSKNQQTDQNFPTVPTTVGGSKEIQTVASSTANEKQFMPFKLNSHKNATVLDKIFCSKEEELHQQAVLEKTESFAEVSTNVSRNCPNVITNSFVLSKLDFKNDGSSSDVFVSSSTNIHATSCDLTDNLEGQILVKKPSRWGMLTVPSKKSSVDTGDFSSEIVPENKFMNVSEDVENDSDLEKVTQSESEKFKGLSNLSVDLQFQNKNLEFEKKSGLGEPSKEMNLPGENDTFGSKRLFLHAENLLEVKSSEYLTGPIDKMSHSDGNENNVSLYSSEPDVQINKLENEWGNRNLKLKLSSSFDKAKDNVLLEENFIKLKNLIPCSKQRSQKADLKVNSYASEDRKNDDTFSDEISSFVSDTQINSKQSLTEELDTSIVSKADTSKDVETGWSSHSLKIICEEEYAKSRKDRSHNRSNNEWVENVRDEERDVTWYKGDRRRTDLYHRETSWKDGDKTRRENFRREDDRVRREDDRGKKRKDDLERNSRRKEERRRDEPERESSRRDDEHFRRDISERERSLREKEWKERRDRSKHDSNHDRRTDRDRHYDRRERNRHEVKDRSRSPKRERRDSRENRREDRTHSPQGDFWHSSSDHKLQECKDDVSGKPYVEDIPLPGSSLSWSTSQGQSDMDLSCSPASSPLSGFKRSLADSTISDSELISCSKQEETVQTSCIQTVLCSPSASYQKSEITPSSQDLYEGQKIPPYITQQSVDSPLVHQTESSPCPTFSPKRLSLDDRIEIELGVKKTAVGPSTASGESVFQQGYSYSNYYNQPASVHYENYSTESAQYKHEEFQAPYPVASGQFSPAAKQIRRPPLLPTPTHIRPVMPVNWDNPEAFIGSQQSSNSRVVQVGNMLQVVPTDLPPAPPPPPPPLPKGSKVLQAGNMLQVIPSDNVPCMVPSPNVPASPVSTTQVVQVGNMIQVIPSSPVLMVPPGLPSPVATTSSLVSPAAHELVHQMKSGVPAPIPPVQGDSTLPALSAFERAQIEKPKRAKHERGRHEKVKNLPDVDVKKSNKLRLKKATEKIKISLQKAFQQEGEGLAAASDIDLEEMRLIEEAMQEVPEPEEDIAMAAEHLSTTKKKRKRKKLTEIAPLPPAGRGILVSPGFREKTLTSTVVERKTVKFADGICPGEGTSPSAGEDLPSPPPPPRKLPKEKRFKKKKKKKKIKVKIIRQFKVEDEEEEDDYDDDSIPPPPPPDTPPPPHLFSQNFAGNYTQPGYNFPTATPYSVVPGSEGSSQYTAPVFPQHHLSTANTTQFAAPPPPPPPPPPLAHRGAN